MSRFLYSCYMIEEVDFLTTIENGEKQTINAVGRNSNI